MGKLEHPIGGDGSRDATRGAGDAPIDALVCDGEGPASFRWDNCISFEVTGLPNLAFITHKYHVERKKMKQPPVEESALLAPGREAALNHCM